MINLQKENHTKINIVKLVFIFENMFFWFYSISQSGTDP